MSTRSRGGDCDPKNAGGNQRLVMPKRKSGAAKRKDSSMESEEKGFDAGEMFDEGVAEAGLESEETASDTPAQEDKSGVVSQVAEDTEKTGTEETEQAETETKEEEKKAADSSTEEIQEVLESTETPESEPESVIETMLPKVEDVEMAQEQQRKSGQYVPVDDHIKLRKRAQTAEQERDDLKRKLEETPTGGEMPGESEKSPLKKFIEENPDEDIVPPIVQLEDREFHEAQQRKAEQARQKVEQDKVEVAEAKQRTVDSIKAIGKKALDSEKAVRKANPDFDSVTLPFVKANLLTDAERLEFLKDENPAQKLYDICKAKRDALKGVFGTPSTTTPTEKPTEKQAPITEDTATEDAELSDEEIYEEIYDK